MEIVDHVFVYGTLLRGMSAANLLDDLDAEFVDEARVRGRLYFSDFPHLLTPSNQDDIVLGELYRLPHITAALVALDAFEREGELYTRTLTEVTSAGGNVVIAWLYRSRRMLPEQNRIVSGSYREYVQFTESRSSSDQ